MKKEDYDGAAQEAHMLLDGLPSLATIAKAHLLRGKALVNKAMVKMDDTGEIVPQEIFDEIWEAFNL